LLSAAFAACAAAFTPTHVVVTDGAPFYETARPGDAAAVVSALRFWTPVEKETATAGVYVAVRLADGRTGSVMSKDLGRLYVVAVENAPLRSEPGDAGAEVSLLPRGAAVAATEDVTLAGGAWEERPAGTPAGRAIVPGEEAFGWLRVTTEAHLAGWLRAADVSPHADAAFD
jgi:hypothetical protein